VFLVVLAAVPVSIIVYTCAAHRNLAPSSRSLRAVFDVLFSPYAAHAVPWNAVFLLQRFLLITLNTFLVATNTRVQVLTAMCLFMLMLHVLVQPFNSASMNRFQLFCLSLLVLIGLTNAPAAALVTSGYPSNDVTTHAFSVLAALQTVMLALPLGVAFVLFWRLKYRECMKRRNPGDSRPKHSHHHHTHSTSSSSSAHQSHHRGPSSAVNVHRSTAKESDAATFASVNTPTTRAALMSSGTESGATPRAESFQSFVVSHSALTTPLLPVTSD
jgi:hypothetical protein